MGALIRFPDLVYKTLYARFRYSQKGRVEGHEGQMLLTTVQEGTLVEWMMKDDANMYDRVRSCTVVCGHARSCAMVHDGAQSLMV